MAYLRGAVYIWGDGESEGFHFWSAYGDDGWEEAGWHDSVKRDPGPPPLNAGSGPSGAWVPAEAIDQFVVMRFSEILEEGRILEVIQQVIDGHSDGDEIFYRGQAALRLKALIEAGLVTRD